MPQDQGVTSGRSFTWNFYSKAGLEARQGDDSFPRGSLGRVVAGVCHRSLGCCQHPPVESAPMGALAAMTGSIWGLPSSASPCKAGWGSCSLAQHFSKSRMLPGTRCCCLALCACFPRVKEESSGWQIPVLSSASCRLYSLSTQVCPHSERDSKFQVTSAGLNFPVGASLHWIQPLPAARGLLLTLGGPLFISQEQG